MTLVPGTGKHKVAYRGDDNIVVDLTLVRTNITLRINTKHMREEEIEAEVGD